MKAKYLAIIMGIISGVILTAVGIKKIKDCMESVDITKENLYNF